MAAGNALADRPPRPPGNRAHPTRTICLAQTHRQDRGHRALDGRSPPDRFVSSDPERLLQPPTSALRRTRCKGQRLIKRPDRIPTPGAWRGGDHCPARRSVDCGAQRRLAARRRSVPEVRPAARGFGLVKLELEAVDTDDPQFANHRGGHLEANAQQGTDPTEKVGNWLQDTGCRAKIAPVTGVIGVEDVILSNPISFLESQLPAHFGGAIAG